MRADSYLISRRKAALPLQPRAARWAAAAALGVALVAASPVPAAPQQQDDQQQEKSQAGSNKHNVHLDNQSRKALLEWVLAHPGVVQRGRGHRLTGIRITLDAVTDDASATKTVATAVIFDHTDGEARRVEIDTDSGEILAEQTLPGRPQSSREEFEEAIQVIRDDPELGGLLDEGAVLDGGFIVDDPGGSRRRMIQLKLLSRDRYTLLRSITVDLTLGVIASSTGVGP